MEVEIFHVLEFGLGRGKHLLAQFDVIVHRAADVEEQQHLDLVVALRPHQDVEHPGFFRGGADGAVQIELFRRAVAGEAAMTSRESPGSVRVTHK
jgi:hypothetical protein